MKNTKVDKDNNKVQVNYLYKETLENLGENYFSATWRTQTLHTKVYTQPMVASEMDKYIKEQMNNNNYIKPSSQKSSSLLIIHPSSPKSSSSSYSGALCMALL